MTAFEIRLRWTGLDIETDDVSAATWAEIEFWADDYCLSVVQSYDDLELRKYLRASAYPLAEWIAFNWWFLVTPLRGTKTKRGRLGRLVRRAPNLHEAGGGFPWPRISIRAESSCFSLRQEALPEGRHRIIGVSSGERIVARNETIFNLRTFVLQVIEKLEHAGIEGTALQAEWARVQGFTQDEADFCRVAASLGLDGSWVEDRQAQAILDAAGSGLSGHVLEQLGPASDALVFPSAAKWAAQGIGRLEELLRETSAPPINLQALAKELPSRPLLTSTTSGGITPWDFGWQAARDLRRAIGLAPEERVHLQDLLLMDQARVAAPGRIGGMGLTHDGGPTAVAVGPHMRRARFVCGQVVAHHAFGDLPQTVVIWPGNGFMQRAARAFSTEFLAPAEGILGVLDGELSDAARERVAAHFGAPLPAVHRQIQNQLLEDAS